MTARLFGFGDSPAAAVYVPPPGRVDRVSLAWWSNGLDDATPLFTGSEDRPTTIVVRWPTDHSGLVDIERLGDAKVAIWTTSPSIFATLRARHDAWHLGRHDLLISCNGGLLAPCTESLLRLVFERPDLALVPIRGRIHEDTEVIAAQLVARSAAA